MKKIVYFSNLKKRYLLVSIAIFIFLILLNEVASGLKIVTYVQLSINGLQTNAIILDSNCIQRDITTNPGKPMPHTIRVVEGYYIKYKFNEITNKTIITKEWVEIPEHLWNDISTNKNIEIIYYEKDPEVNIPQTVFSEYIFNSVVKIAFFIFGSVTFSFIIVFFSYTELKRHGLYRSKK
jgi:hypothetical protein